MDGLCSESILHAASACMKIIWKNMHIIMSEVWHMCLFWYESGRKSYIELEHGSWQVCCLDAQTISQLQLEQLLVTKD